MKRKSFDNIIAGVVVIGILILYFFPEPETNFIYYFGTMILFGLTMLVLIIKRNKK